MSFWVQEAVDEWIKGAIAKRTRLPLRSDDVDVRAVLEQRLPAHGYTLGKVADVDVAIGFRCPAFVFEEDWVYFAWVKWTNIDNVTYKKFLASVICRPSGTPLIMMDIESVRPIWVNAKLAETHDPDGHPTYE